METPDGNLKVRLKSREELEKLGFIYEVLKHSDKVILTNKKHSWKSVAFKDMDQVFVVSDDMKVLSEDEYAAFGDAFDIVK